jgi:hypothetical protein
MAIETREQLDSLLDMREEMLQALVAESLRRIVFSREGLIAMLAGVALATTATLGAWDYWNTSRTQRQWLIKMEGQILALQEAQGLREEIEENQELLRQLTADWPRTEASDGAGSVQGTH